MSLLIALCVKEGTELWRKGQEGLKKGVKTSLIKLTAEAGHKKKRAEKCAEGNFLFHWFPILDGANFQVMELWSQARYTTSRIFMRHDIFAKNHAKIRSFISF